MRDAADDQTSAGIGSFFGWPQHGLASKAPVRSAKPWGDPSWPLDDAANRSRSAFTHSLQDISTLPP
jgi:hypothetical protein